MAFIFKAIKVGIISLIFKYIFKLFKKNIAYFKLINIYLYSKIAKNIILLFGTFFITEGSKKALIEFTTGKLNSTEYIKILYSADNAVYLLFSTISFILFYYLLIYGIKISFKNKIAPIKNSPPEN
jgi:hypothetical protein